jgi:hypothetical protein
MEVLFALAITSCYLLLDALSVNRALRSRLNPSSANSSIGPLYVFARRQASQTVKTDRPVIYYIPCDNPQTAQKLASVIHRHVAERGNIVKLPDLGSLEKYVSAHYQLTRFDLSPFPIPTHKILEADAAP